MSDLAKLNLKQLRERARDLEIPGRSKLRKAELILALLQARKQPQQHPPSPRPVTAESAAPAGSSSTTATDSTPRPSPGPDGEPGLPLPDSYGRDVAVLMVQDPHHLYAWWELSGTAREQASQRAGSDASAVLVVRGPDGIEQREIDLEGGSYYLHVAANASYQVALALRGADGQLHLLAESQTVRTPPDTISDRVDQEWLAVDDTFAQLVAAAEQGGGDWSSAERLRQDRRWATTPVEPWFSGHLGSSWSSTCLSSRSLGDERQS